MFFDIAWHSFHTPYSSASCFHLLSPCFTNGRIWGTTILCWNFRTTFLTGCWGNFIRRHWKMKWGSCSQCGKCHQVTKSPARKLRPQYVPSHWNGKRSMRVGFGVQEFELETCSFSTAPLLAIGPTASMLLCCASYGTGSWSLPFPTLCLSYFQEVQKAGGHKSLRPSRRILHDFHQHDWCCDVDSGFPPIVHS